MKGKYDFVNHIIIMKKNKSLELIINIFMSVVSVLTLLPLILLFIASITSNKEIIISGYSFFPKHISMEAYKYIWNEKSQIFQAYFITILVTTIGTTIGLLVTMSYAYVLSKPKFPGKKFFMFFVLFTMLFNGGLVPTYIMYTRYLNIKNTIFALIIPALLMNAYNVILIRSYIKSNISQSLIEAATIDGANEYRIFWKVILPLSKPIAVTIGLFIGVAYWNDWRNGLYYVTENKLYSIQQLLNNMLRNIEYLSKNSSSNIVSSGVSNTIPQATVRMAIAVVGIIPILIIYPYVQKYFVKGISLGAIKG